MKLLLKKFVEENMVKSEGEDWTSAVLPLLKLLTLTVIGLVLAHPRTHLVPKATFTLLSKLVFALFLPCLIFTQLGECITLKNFTLWWFIPANMVISTVIGCILGYFVALVCRPPPEFFRLTVIMTGFGNTGNLPLAIISSVCHNKENPFGPDCYQTGVSYVVFSQWVAVFLLYTLVYHMMEPPTEYYEVIEDNSAEIEEEQDVNNLSKPLLDESEWSLVDDELSVSNGDSNNEEGTMHGYHALEEGGIPKSPRFTRCLAEPNMVKKIRIVAEEIPIGRILQPAIIASLLAIIVGMVPQFKSFTFGIDAPLAFITDSLTIMAQALVPSVMLILGGMLADGPNESRLGLKTTIGIMVSRLLILPFLGIGVVILADKMNFLIRGDQMYRFVLLLQYTTPSAILLGAIARLRGYGVSEASALLFWQHLFALVSLSVYIIIYFKLLLSYV